MKNVLMGLLFLLSLLICFQGCKKDEVVDAELIVSPEQIMLNGLDTAIIYLSTSPETEVTWQVSGAPDWLEINPTSGKLKGSITEVQLVSRLEGLDQEQYFEQVEIISNKAGKGSCTVILYVGSNPVATLSPNTLNFQAGTDSLYLSLANTGSGNLEWQLLTTVEWLHIIPSSGFCEGGDDRNILVKVVRENMAVGDYNASIQLVSNTSMPVQDVPVQMAVPESYTIATRIDTVYFGFFFEERELYISNSGNMTFTWDLDIPEGYLAADNLSGSLDPGDSARVVITADRQGLASGTYLSDLVFSNNKGGTLAVPVVVKKYAEEKWLLEGKIIDAEYDRVHDVIIAVTDYPYRLIKLNPVSQTMTEVSLGLAPICISVNPAGTHAVVGHDANVTYIDLLSMSKINVFNTPEIAFDIVIAPNSYAYIFPATGQWTNILCLNLATGSQSQSAGYSIRETTRAKLHPSGEYIYGADNGVSPSDFEKYDIRLGTAELMYDSPYHGDFSFGGDIWISDDGSRLFARSRNVFISTTNPATDMTYNGQLSGDTYLQTLDHSSASGSIFAIGFGGDVWDTFPSDEVRMYEDVYLNYTGSITLPGFMVPDGSGDGTYFKSEGHFGFFNSNGDKFFVLVRAQEGSGMLNDWAVAILQ